jgi:hypothetical protein
LLQQLASKRVLLFCLSCNSACQFCPLCVKHLCLLM